MIRLYKAGDEQAIAEIERQSFSSPWSAAAVSESAESGTEFTVLEDSGQIVGYAGIQVIEPEGYITNIAILPEFRGRGFGDLLVSALKDLAKERSLDFISLEVRESNTVAISLYRKHGFKEKGRRKNFYTSPNEDAIIMTLEGNI